MSLLLHASTRRSWLRRAALTLAVASTLLAGVMRAPAAVTAVGPIRITVSDLDRAVDFYTRALDFERVDARPAPDARLARLRLGAESIELREASPSAWRPLPADSRSNDLWFQHVAVIVSDLDAAYARLRRHGVEHVSTSPQRLPDWNLDAGGIRAFYFKDPDGHPLEVLQFPPGKGDARWQTGGGRLFLGIDHTAIVVADSDVSLRFYRDLLGMRIAGTSDNHGVEQERLSGVPGAHVRITTLRAPHGPGIELLEYLAPLDGRAAPPGERSADFVHWQTRLEIDDDARFVRDPDGHALELVGEREDVR